MKWARVLVVAALAGSATLLGLLPRAEAARWWKLAWTLDVSVTRPKRVPVHEPGGTALYTYLTYTITNRSLREVNVVPLPVLVTDTLKTYYNQTQPVVKAIAERRERKKLAGPADMLGPLKVGDSRTGIIAFRNVDLAAKRWDLYITGLSGEYVLQLIPGRAEPVVRHKAYHVQYRIRGDRFEPSDDEIEVVKEEWTYR